MLPPRMLPLKAAEFYFESQYIYMVRSPNKVFGKKPASQLRTPGPDSSRNRDSLLVDHSTYVQAWPLFLWRTLCRAPNSYRWRLKSQNLFLPGFALRVSCGPRRCDPLRPHSAPGGRAPARPRSRARLPRPAPASAALPGRGRGGRGGGGGGGVSGGLGGGTEAPEQDGGARLRAGGAALASGFLRRGQPRQLPCSGLR